MDLTLILILSFAMIFNFIVIKIKLEKQRYIDAAIDAGVFALLSYMFMGSLTGIVMAGTSSFLFSIYLLFFPPKFNFEEENQNIPTMSKQDYSWI